MHRPAKTITGFTLVELLVVVAIIALLIAILLPSLSSARQTALIAACSSKHHQIATAWAMYAFDNTTQLVGSHTGPYTWVKFPSTNIAETPENLQQGKLWPYLNALSIYRCPSDPREYLRSYSISIYLAGGTGWHITPVLKFSAITSPSSRLLMLDEHDIRAHNQGAWAIYPRDHPQQGWIDWPAPWHLGNGNVTSFADGHVEFYRFVDPATSAISAFFTPAPNSPDLIHYQKIYTP